MNNSLVKNNSIKVADLPYMSTLALYGGGELARAFLDEIVTRPDLKVKFVFDSFKSGRLLDYEVQQYNKARCYDVDIIIIASAFWPTILSTIEKNCSFIYIPSDSYKLSIVSEENKTIYIRNPRVASTSITKMMLAEGAQQKVIDIESPEYKNFFVFSLVRDPLQKFLSAYDGIARKKNDPKSTLDISPIFMELNMDENPIKLDQFIDIYMQIDVDIIDVHFRLQSEILKTNREIYVGYFENLVNEFQYISDKTGLFKNQELTNHNPMNEYLKKQRIVTGSQLKRIEKIYMKDYMKYGYSLSLTK